MAYQFVPLHGWLFPSLPPKRTAAQLVSHSMVWPHLTGNSGYATAAIARSISSAGVACSA
jgi:hypothetical protein